MMGSKNKTLALVVVLVAVFFLALSLFIVDETKRAIGLRLGNIIIDSNTKEPQVLKPGLRAKLPLLDTVRFFDKRIQSLEISSSRIPTQRKKELIVYSFTKWLI